jgi:hypothetical protein
VRASKRNPWEVLREIQELLKRQKGKRR